MDGAVVDKISCLLTVTGDLLIHSCRHYLGSIKKGSFFLEGNNYLEYKHGIF